MNYLVIRDAINRKLGKDTKLRPVLEFAQGLDFGARYLRHEVLPRPKVAATREVYIEWVNYCNLRCSFCALDHSMQKQRMSAETWRLALEELTTPAFNGVEALHLHNGGETLLHPKAAVFLAILDEVFDRAVTEGKHVPKVDLLTNAMVLTPSKREAILNTKHISSLQFSMDGGTPEAFEAIRNRAKWDVFQPNILALLQENQMLAQPKRTGLIALLPNETLMKTKEFHPEYQAVIDLVDDVEFRLAHNWAGQMDGQDTVVKQKPWKLGCNMMMDQLVVFPDGGVSICCNDLNAQAVVANIHEDGLYGAYLSKERRNWLFKMARNNTAEIPLCNGCERF